MKTPKKAPPQPAQAAPPRHAYHVYATRNTPKSFSTFSGVVQTRHKILGDAGFWEVSDWIAKSLDADAAGKPTKGAYLTIESLTYLGELPVNETL